jgi:phosphotriesterase-related protein
VTVPTALGPVGADALGVTLMHEHVFLRDLDVELNTSQAGPGRWDEERELANAVAKLTELKAHGVDTIVDLSVIGHGRDAALLRRVAERSPVTIVLATGVYTYDEMPFGLRFRGPRTHDGEDPLVTIFVHDLTEGIADTGIRAAIIKAVTDHAGVTPGVERCLRAAARAHLQTGAPITTHTDPHTQRGLDQQRVFAEEGVDLGRVVIGHSGDTNDLDYLQRLLDAGSYLGMDRFGITAPLDTAQRVELVATLCEKGYAERMVLSHDTMCYVDWFGEWIYAAQPDWHYLHIPDAVLPALRERGVTDHQIEQMLVTNPRLILEQK